MNNLKKEKILVISHNCFNDNSGMGKTLKSLFHNYKDEEVSQLYFRNELPEKNYKREYFRIIDMDVVRKILRIKKKCGEKINLNEFEEIKTVEKKAYEIGSKKIFFFEIIREIIWKSGVWKEKELELWINNINPNIIFFVPGNYLFSYNILFHIKKMKQTKLCIYFTDDYFYEEKSLNFIKKIKKKCLINLAKRAIKESDLIFTICEKMSEEYQEIFKINCEELTNGIEIKNFKLKRKEKEFYISYIGNIHSNRWKNLIDIGEVLDKFNNNNNKNIYLDIYAPEIEKKVLKLFQKVKCIRINKPLNFKEVLQVQAKSDLLIHVEAFDEKFKKLTRLSMSTKIPEYLAQGRCILAYGPKDVASIEYLENKKIALTCCNKENLYESIERIIFDENLRIKYQEEARKIGIENFNYKLNNQKFKIKIKNLL